MTEICIDLEKSNSGLLPKEFLKPNETVEIVGPPRSRKTTLGLKSAKKVAEKNSGTIFVVSRTIRSAEASLDTWKKYVDPSGDYSVIFRAGADDICPELPESYRIPHSFGCYHSKKVSIKRALYYFNQTKYLDQEWRKDIVKFLGEKRNFCPVKAQKPIIQNAIRSKNKNVIFCTYKGIDILRNLFKEEEWLKLMSQSTVVFDEWRHLNELSIKNSLELQASNSDDNPTEVLAKEFTSYSLNLLDEKTRSNVLQAVRDSIHLISGYIVEAQQNDSLQRITQETTSPLLNNESHEINIPDKAFQTLGDYIRKGENVEEAKNTYELLQFLSSLQEEGVGLVADYSSSTGNIYLKLREMQGNGYEANRSAKSILRNSHKSFLIDATPFPKTLDKMVLGKEVSRKRVNVRPPFTLNVAVEGIQEGAYDFRTDPDSRDRLINKLDKIIEYLERRNLEPVVIARNRFEKNRIESELDIECGYARGDMVEGVSLDGDIPILTGLPIQPSNSESFREKDLNKLFSETSGENKSKTVKQNYHRLKAWQEAIQIIYRCSELQPRSAIILNCGDIPSLYLLDHWKWLKSGLNVIHGKGSATDDKALSLARSCLQGEESEDPRKLRSHKQIFDYLKEDEANKSELRSEALTRYDNVLKQEFLDEVEEKGLLNLVPELGGNGTRFIEVDDSGRSKNFSLYYYYNIDISTTLEPNIPDN